LRRSGRSRRTRSTPGGTSCPWPSGSSASKDPDMPHVVYVFLNWYNESLVIVGISHITNSGVFDKEPFLTRVARWFLFIPKILIWVFLEGLGK
jgi:hypothetical protein